MKAPRRPTPPAGVVTEQPAKRKDPNQSLFEASPWLPSPFDLASVSAIQALTRGEASPEQQKTALGWILRSACALPEWPYRPGMNDRDTNIALGRHYVGHQIVRMQQADIAKLRRTEPNADPHDPQS